MTTQTAEPQRAPDAEEPKVTEDELYAEYVRLSEVERYLPASTRCWAVNEALNFILDHIAAGTAAQCTPQKILDKIGNAAAKFRYRQTLLSIYGRGSCDSSVPEDRVEIRQRLGRCGPREQSILIAGGMGFSTQEIAEAHGAPTGSIKTWAFRGRATFAA